MRTGSLPFDCKGRRATARRICFDMTHYSGSPDYYWFSYPGAWIDTTWVQQLTDCTANEKFQETRMKLGIVLSETTNHNRSAVSSNGLFEYQTKLERFERDVAVDYSRRKVRRKVAHRATASPNNCNFSHTQARQKTRHDGEPASTFTKTGGFCPDLAVR